MEAFNSGSLRVFVLVMMSLLVVPFAHAAFSNASLKGGYSFMLNRWTADVNASQEGTLGLLTFDGAGGVTASFTQMKNGVLSTGTATGTYAINANGTGTVNLTTQNGSVQFTIVLNSTAAGVAQSVQLLITNDTTNSVTSGTAVLQSTQAVTYNAASLKGNLAFQLNSWTADPNQSRDGIIGLFSFNGAGKVKGSFTEMKAGVLQTGTFTGTYTVNSDGTGAMSLVSGKDRPQLALVLNSVAAGHAKGLQLLQTTEKGNNRVHSGIALKQ